MWGPSMNSDVRRIVVTGASGFLGSHLLERLKGDERYTVVALSSKAEALRQRVGGENIEYIDKDALLDGRAGTILPGSIVVHCAYPRASTGVAIADGLRYIRDVFESAVENGARAIVNISSQSVYSPQRTEAATEDTPVSLESPYAVGKYATELMLGTACRHSNTAYTSVRMASLIGPGFDQRIVNRFVKQALETGKLMVKRNEQRFGFFDVEDAVSGLMAMLSVDPADWKPVYNLGRSGASTLAEIAELVKRVLIAHGARDEVDIEYTADETHSTSALNAEMFCSDFHFEPGVDLSESIDRIATLCERQL